MNSVLLTDRLPIPETAFGEACAPCESDGIRRRTHYRGSEDAELFTDEA